MPAIVLPTTGFLKVEKSISGITFEAEHIGDGNTRISFYNDIDYSDCLYELECQGIDCLGEVNSPE